MSKLFSVMICWLALSASCVQAADPVLTDGRVSPIAGYPNSTYTFYVSYSDADGDAGAPLLYLNELGAKTMTRLESGTPDWTQPVEFQVIVYGINARPFDVNQFYFQAGTARYPVDPDTLLTGPVINYAPVLSNGYASFITYGQQTAGLRGMDVGYEINYRDANGDAPDVGFPIAWIGNSAGWNFSGGIVSKAYQEVTLIKDASKTWTPSQFKDQPLNYFTGGRVGLTDTILDNTSNTLIVLGHVDDVVAETPLVGDKFKINENSGTITEIDYRAAAFVDYSKQYTPGALTGERLQLVSSIGDSAGDPVAGVMGRIYTIAGNTAQFILIAGQEYPTTVDDPDLIANGVNSGVAYSIHDVLVGTVANFDLQDSGFVSLQFGNSPNWETDQFAGLVLYVVNGSATSIGKSYQIWSNTTDTILFAESENDMIDSDLKNGDLVRVAGVSMAIESFLPPTALDYADYAGMTATNTIRGFADHLSTSSILHTARWMVSNSIEGYGERVSYQAWYPLLDPLLGPVITNSIPSPNSLPQLRNASASPLKGTVSTNFDFSIDYKDTEGDAPGPHDGVVGNVTLFLEATNGTRIFRASADFGGGAWPAGLWRTISPTVFDDFRVDAGTLPAGNYRYHFEASDGWRSSRFPSNPENDPAIVVNSKPTLATPSVTPTSGNTGTVYRFRVTYTDADNTAPSAINLVLDGVVSGLAKEDTTDDNFIDGVVYYVDKTALGVGAHSFHFTANDDVESATDTATISGPTVRASNTAPILASGAVTPTTSKLEGNSFSYSVNYRDANGDAPNSVTVTIYDTDGLTILDTETMTQASSGSPDYAAAGGVQFVYSGYSFLNSGRYYYKFTATDGLLNATGDNGLKVGPTVNSIPVLSLPSLTPDQGPSSGFFTYSVKYTDPDNVGPGASGYVRVAVILNGVTTKYDLTAQSSTGWITGVVYSRQIQLATGVYSYYFEANDGSDSAVSTSESAGPTSDAAPELRSAAVTPSSGKSTDTYSYTVTFANPDNTAPSEIKVFIDGTAVANGFAMSKVILSDTNFVSGVQYRHQTTLTPGSHTWFIRATVGGLTIYPAGQSSSSPEAGPTVNNPPIIVGATVDPTFGRTTTDFTYTVIYRDADGIAPGASGYVRIQIPGVTNPLILAPQGSAWSTGVTYTGTCKLAGGVRSFYVEASDGIEATRLPAGTSAFDGPRVSSPPTLTVGSVTPTTGGSTSLFTYTVTYTDADNDAPAADSVKVLIDGQPFTMAKTNSADITYTDGAVYSYSTQLTAGTQHNYKFQASDGIDLVSSSVVANSPVVSTSSITLNSTPNPVQLGNTVTFSGQVLPAGAVAVALIITKPSGASVIETVSSDSSGVFSLDVTADEVGVWAVSASVTAGSVILNPALTVSPATIRVQGGVVDMISSPVTTLTGDPASIFGATEAQNMNIVRWDAFLGAYQRYGTSASFPVLHPGSGFWIKPTTTMTVALSGSLADQTQEISTAVLAGWNQIGSGFVQTVDWGQVKIRYQGQTVSLAQATTNGWVKDYAWGYDSLANSYFLVRSAGGSSSVLDPFRGYWFRANVACELLVQPSVAQ